MNPNFFNDSFIISLSELFPSLESKIKNILLKCIQDVDNLNLIKNHIDNNSSDNLFNLIIQLNNELINFICNYLSNIELSQLQLSRFKNITKKKFEKNTILELFNHLIENDNYENSKFYKNIDFIYYIIHKIANHNGEMKQNINKKLNKYLKLSDHYYKLYNHYIKKNSLLFHNDKFEIKQKIIDNGFLKYCKKDNIYFKNLSNHFNNSNNLHKLTFDNNSNLNHKNISHFNKFIFLIHIQKLIQYNNDLLDETSEISRNSIHLFSTLQDIDNLTLKDQNKKISSFIIDLFLHFYEESIDDLWLKKLNNDSIINNITKKKEEEYIKKQKEIDNKSQSEKNLDAELQNIGLEKLSSNNNDDDNQYYFDFLDEDDKNDDDDIQEDGGYDIDDVDNDIHDVDDNNDFISNDN